MAFGKRVAGLLTGLSDMLFGGLVSHMPIYGIPYNGTLSFD
jgi:hypothetical protein